MQLTVYAKESYIQVKGLVLSKCEYQEKAENEQNIQLKILFWLQKGKVKERKRKETK